MFCEETAESRQERRELEDWKKDVVFFMKVGWGRTIFELRKTVATAGLTASACACTEQSRSCTLGEEKALKTKGERTCLSVGVTAFQ